MRSHSTVVVVEESRNDRQFRFTEPELLECVEKAFGTGDDAVATTVWQPPCEYLETAVAEGRSVGESRREHGQFVLIGEQCGAGTGVADVGNLRRHAHNSMRETTWVGVVASRHAVPWIHGFRRRDRGRHLLGERNDERRYGFLSSSHARASRRLLRPSKPQISPWVTIVWDDPVNLMHYVTYVFQKLFGYSKAKATDLMMQVHSEGKAVVSSGSRDKMETDVQSPPRCRSLGHDATRRHLEKQLFRPICSPNS